MSIDASTILYAVGAFLLTACLTGVTRSFARRSGILDIPNQRSSHQRATPRGGGLAVVVVVQCAVIALFAVNDLPANLFVALIVGGTMVAAVGFIDDIFGLAATWRFLVHGVAASVAVLVLDGPGDVQVGTTVINLGWAGIAIAVLLVVWLVNLFNFMDGIDGIAGVEAIFVVGSAAAMLTLSDGGYIVVLLTVFFAALSGFLLWNWPPARIFMGDVGSGYIGFVIAACAIYTSSLQLLPPWTWLILSGVFVVDATFTLITRMILGEAWYSAHNNHAYQKASRQLQGHRPVTISVLCINLAWLLPIGWFATMRPEFGWWLTAVAWAPLVALSAMLRAGRPD